MNLNFCQKNYTLNWDVYLNMCVLKHEIIVYLTRLSARLVVKIEFQKTHVMTRLGQCFDYVDIILNSLEPFLHSTLLKLGVFAETLNHFSNGQVTCYALNIFPNLGDFKILMALPT